VWPIEERPVPQSDVPGERLSPTQPYPTKPPAFAKQTFSEDDLIDFTPELRAKALEAIAPYSLGDMYSPPTLHGTLSFPSVSGGANWGGAGFDPETQILYVKAVNWPLLFFVEKPPPGTEDADYYLGDFKWVTIDGAPIHKPPYSTLTAIDLNKGEHVWQVPFGDPLITAGGLLFLSSGTRNLYIFNKRNGELVDTIELDGHGYGNPITYRTASGKQFVVIATSGKDGSDAKLNAFALAD
jgi:quinoprotein glucose dehydrogenase